MRHKDPELMKRINTFIGEFYAANDRTPSTTEIAKHFGIARSTSRNYLVAMNDRGVLSCVGGILQVDRADEVQTREMHCPMCGFPVQIIPVTQTDIVFAKCHKCKFTGPLDPAYFRRMKRLDAYQRRLKECVRSNRR